MLLGQASLLRPRRALSALLAIQKVSTVGTRSTGTEILRGEWERGGTRPYRAGKRFSHFFVQFLPVDGIYQ
jgi:hypothetical protein